MQLRDYQTELVQKIRAAITSGYRRILCTAPTGSGKTVTFSYISSRSAASGKKVMLVVHRRELVDQISETLDKFDVRHGIIAAGTAPNPFCKVQVASVQTVAKRMDKIAFRPDVIIVDEAHHAAAGTWKKVLKNYLNALVLGFTATPERLDGKGLDDVFQIMVQGPEVADLIAEGYLCQPIYFAPPIAGVETDGLKITAGDFNKAQTALMMDKPSITGDAISHYLRICPGVPAIAFCTSVSHAEHTAEAFRSAGISSASIDGTMTKFQRRKVVLDFASGRLQVLTSCDLISEGVDIPKVTAAINLRPTASLGMHLQQLGRCLRPSDGKKNAIILDHVGNILRHGLAEDLRNWTLKGRPKGKRGAKKETAVPVKACPECYAMHSPAPSCPQCGHAYDVGRKIDQVEGDLVQIEEAPTKTCDDCNKQYPIKAETCPHCRRKEQGRAQSYQDLVRVGRARNMRNPEGWARHVFNAREKKRKRIQTAR